MPGMNKATKSRASKRSQRRPDALPMPARPSKVACILREMRAALEAHVPMPSAHQQQHNGEYNDMARQEDDQESGKPHRKRA
jgi:hypothetical protein